MPIEDVLERLQALGPNEPHLAVLTAPGQAIAMKRGTQFFYVADPERIDRKIPMILTRITLHAIHAQCGCGKPGCNRTFVFKMHPMGHHPTGSSTPIASPK